MWKSTSQQITDKQSEKRTTFKIRYPGGSAENISRNNFTTRNPGGSAGNTRRKPIAWFISWDIEDEAEEIIPINFNTTYECSVQITTEEEAPKKAGRRSSAAQPPSTAFWLEWNQSESQSIVPLSLWRRCVSSPTINHPSEPSNNPGEPEQTGAKGKQSSKRRWMESNAPSSEETSRSGRQGHPTTLDAMISMQVREFVQQNQEPQNYTPRRNESDRLSHQPNSKRPKNTTDRRGYLIDL
ncbi:hypothetical protein GE061_015977 [Apolygus lucorum]|uniref:Uncharacterized protein n=1 Tax=Apolygus lucorum TaxID=248454 RepID=A0A8S9XGW8_APOLU|nr:hypothetical protein GE061_015977 [Apolygus lucorum]